MPVSMNISCESFPIAGSFTISRGSRTEAKVVMIELSVPSDKGKTFMGRGECVPYARYGETVESVKAQLQAIKPDVEKMSLMADSSTADVQSLLEPGAARNALDCAIWDLLAKLSHKPVWQLAKLAKPAPVVTAYTISLGTAETMAAQTESVRNRQLLKVKLGGDGDIERMLAVRQASPDAQLILDANEAWDEHNLKALMATARQIGASLIEQPLPAGKDAMLGDIERSVPVCADESLHTRHQLAKLRKLYDCINIKLDKAGGLTEAIALHRNARALGFQIMIGCMVSTSLSMAAALMLAQDAEFIDLDGPLLLARDRGHGLRYEGSLVYPADHELWG